MCSRYLPLGERLGDLDRVRPAGDPPVEFGQPGPQGVRAVGQHGQHIPGLFGQFRGAAAVERDPGEPPAVGRAGPPLRYEG
jgi:hypothetical protein